MDWASLPFEGTSLMGEYAQCGLAAWTEQKEQEFTFQCIYRAGVDTSSASFSWNTFVYS